jgi:hypothetical protein
MNGSGILKLDQQNMEASIQEGGLNLGKRVLEFDFQLLLVIRSIP